MKKRIISVLAVLLSTASICGIGYIHDNPKQKPEPVIIEEIPYCPVPTVKYVEPSPLLEIDQFKILGESIFAMIDFKVETIEKQILTDEEIELIALVTMAEAESEPELGKRLVIDTILNRVDSPHFPNTVKEVIYQPSHFSSMWNGRVDKCEVTDEICQLVIEELESREDSDVVFFHSGKYGKWGKPMYNVENHYFSSY